MKSKRAPIIIIICSLLLVITIVSIFVVKNNTEISNKDKAKPSMVAPEISIHTVMKMSITEDINAYGSVTYYKKINVSSKVEEIVKEIHADVGDIVSKGQILAVLKDDYIKISYSISKEEIASKNSAYRLTRAKYKNAILGVEKNYKNLDRLRMEKKQKEIELSNLSRVIINKKKLALYGGVTKEKIRELDTSYTIAKLQYDSVIKQLNIAEIGFRNEDIKANRYKIPASDNDRLEVLKKMNTSIERSELRIANSQLKKAKTELKSTKMLMEESIVKAPYPGIIAMKYVEPGEKVVKDKPIFTIIQIDSVFVELPVPETDIPRIQLNQKVELSIDAYPDKSFYGIVERVYPMIDPKTRTATVRCLVKNHILENNRYLLLPGMFVRAKIITASKKDALTIPFVSMAEKEGSQIKIFLIKKDPSATNIGIVVEKWVPYVKIRDDYIEIAQDIKENDIVATSGIDFIETGMRIKIKQKLVLSEASSNTNINSSPATISNTNRLATNSTKDIKKQSKNKRRRNRR